MLNVLHFAGGLGLLTLTFQFECLKTTSIFTPNVIISRLHVSSLSRDSSHSMASGLPMKEAERTPMPWIGFDPRDQMSTLPCPLRSHCFQMVNTHMKGGLISSVTPGNPPRWLKCQKSDDGKCWLGHRASQLSCLACGV